MAFYRKDGSSFAQIASGGKGVSDYNELTNKPVIPSKMSELENDSNYVTRDEISTITNVPTKVSELENDKGFITQEEVPTIPSKTSELENDTGFLTNENLPLIPSKTSELENDSNYVTSDGLPVVPTKVSELENDSNFVKAEDLPTVPILDDFPTLDSENAVKSDGVFRRLESKVNVEVGKGLSTNDFSDEYKNKLDSLNNLMVIKGEVAEIAGLPTDAQNGDTYYVGTSPNYEIWTKTEEGWKHTGDSNEVDLSEYLKINQDPSNAGKYLKINNAGTIEFVEGSGSGVGSYGDLADKPKLDGITIKKENTKAELGIMDTATYDSNGDGIVDRAEIALGLLDADQSLPGQVYRHNPTTGEIGFSYLPIEINASRPIPPMTFNNLVADNSEVIELSGQTTSIITQVSEKLNGKIIENEPLDRITSSNAVFYSDRLNLNVNTGLSIKKDYLLNTYTTDKNGYLEYDISDFVSIKSISKEVI